VHIGGDTKGLGCGHTKSDKTRQGRFSVTDWNPQNRFQWWQPTTRTWFTFRWVLCHVD